MAAWTLHEPDAACAACRFTWQSGRAFEGEYDAAPVNISNYVRVDQGNLMQGCDREAYVGCNTWDLMDKSR